MDCAVRFRDVTKEYPLYQHIRAGIKSFLFHLPKHVSSFRQSRFMALSGVSFEIGKGETFGIIGKNGSGKSTILGLIAGVMHQDKGTVETDGRLSSLLELGAGFHPDLSGIENIILNGILMGNTRREMEEKAAAIVEFSELGDFIYQPLRTYSSGMHVRLGFSVAVHVEPEILLIDEALAVGDLGFQEKCLAKMREFRKAGATIIMVSHDMAAIENLCDRVAWLKQGQIMEIGEPEAVVGRYLKDIGQAVPKRIELKESSKADAISSEEPVWWEVPVVVKEYEYQITGRRDLHFYNYLKGRITQTLDRGLCISHRLRGLEKHFVTYGICRSFEAVEDDDAVGRIIREENISRSEQYDLVLCIDLLGNMKDPGLFLKNLKPLIRDGGYIVAMEYMGPYDFCYPGKARQMAEGLLSLIQFGVASPTGLKTANVSEDLGEGKGTPGKIADKILPSLELFFTVLEVRPFGGALLDILINRIVTMIESSTAEGEKFLSQFIAFEQSLIQDGLLEHPYALLIARQTDVRIS